MRDASRRRLLLVAFTLSGFAGLIYESLWTHYLKLFLGHAAYAQTLVLVIFMGGLAAGSFISSRLADRWTNPLRGYAIAEAAIGLVAVLFHPAFVAATEAAQVGILPALGSPMAVTVFKWVLAAALILPQSVVLGMTFPLMAGGFIRAYPSEPGTSLAFLYFTNSLGGAAGVLTSAFLLIPWLGLPGTSVVAGAINLLVAGAVWRTATARRGSAADEMATAEVSPRPLTEAPYRLLIAVSLLTGAASFVYEIGWTRMLSLVLGSSAQAFELMLSAFVLGLAFGGLWIARRIDILTDPIRFLGGVQIAMGALAVATLGVYTWMFPLMRWLTENLPKTDSGYIGFNLASHAIALAVMLPATFLAGTTLPLITFALVRSRHGESSIGMVYGANTVGAIAGVVLAVHVGLEMLGLKYLVAAGAMLDIALGVVLLSAGGARPTRSVVLPQVAAVLWAVSILASVQFDTRVMASGVFRETQPALTADADVVFYRDGKTATIAVSDDGVSVAIRTNGKIDASVNMVDFAAPTVDESTQVLLAALPLLLHPTARRAVNIGLGSGMTSHILLGAPSLERVDTVEIEPAMVEGARRFFPRNSRVFDDPRSHIIIDDAKTVFSTSRQQYDIIVSEPSNPWVSGIASLFSVEFYRIAQRHLAPGGVFVQWLQLYEFDLDLVASVLKALERCFEDYAIYAAAPGDILIVAANGRSVSGPQLDAQIAPELKSALRRVNIRTAQDLTARKLADRRLLQPWVANAQVPANTDFLPEFSARANRARFLNTTARSIEELGFDVLPLLELLGAQVAPAETTDVSFVAASSVLPHFVAMRLRDRLLDKKAGEEDSPVIRAADAILDRCGTGPTQAERALAMFQLGSHLARFLTVSELEKVWPRLESLPCFAATSELETSWLRLFKAVGQRRPDEMASAAGRLLVLEPPSSERRGYVVGAAVLGHLGAGNREAARAVWQGEPLRFTRSGSFAFALLAAHVGR
jgi:spermidine synthase